MINPTSGQNQNNFEERARLNVTRGCYDVLEPFFKFGGCTRRGCPGPRFSACHRLEPSLLRLHENRVALRLVLDICMLLKKLKLIENGDRV